MWLNTLLSRLFFRKKCSHKPPNPPPPWLRPWHSNCGMVVGREVGNYVQASGMYFGGLGSQAYVLNKESRESTTIPLLLVTNRIR